MFSVFRRVAHPSAARRMMRMSTMAEAREAPARRALLYVPGQDTRKVAKAAALGVDSVCLDCEDGVALNRKVEARQGIVEALATLDFGHSERAVRINAPQSELAEADLEALFEAKVLPDCLVVPKVETPAQLDWLFTKVEILRDKRAKRKQDTPTIRLLTQVESALGLLNLREVCDADRSGISESMTLVHDGLILGGDDYAASIGAVRTSDNKELIYARQCMIAHAKAYGLQAIDIVNIHFKNPDILKAEAREGAYLGFTGKQVIHPDQVGVVQAAFSPSQQRVARATAIVDAFRASSEAGAGAFEFEGQMIDMPTVRQCMYVLNLAEAAKIQRPAEKL